MKNLFDILKPALLPIGFLVAKELLKYAEIKIKEAETKFNVNSKTTVNELK